MSEFPSDSPSQSSSESSSELESAAPGKEAMLSPIQARVLGCLVEKEETTPEQYPLTLNALRNACNQKTARHPVVNYTEGEVGHTVRELVSRGFVKEAWGARVSKYEHVVGKKLGLQSKGLSVVCALMLRGPQTLGELKTNTHRLHEFGDLDDVAHMLGRLAEHEPPLVMLLPKQAGQKEARYAHLLCGEPDVSKMEFRSSPSASAASGLEARIDALEQEVAALRELVESLAPSQDVNND